MTVRRVLASTTLLVALGGCAALRPVFAGDVELSEVRQLQLGGATFFLAYDPIDHRVADDIVHALERALPAVERWGAFTSPMTVRIHPTHDALEAAVRRFDYPWLRAWARYDTIDIQSPRTWSLLGASRADVTELVTHELTHCLMYQQAGTAHDWMFKGIPLWFREGMASVTAAQGYRRLSNEELWRHLRRHPRRDPILDAESLYQSQAEFVYGAAHRAFEFLVRRYGDDSVRAILEQMRAGRRFDDAFARVVGVHDSRFSREFVRFVRWEGWRGSKGTGTLPALVPVAPATGSAGR